MKSAHDTSATSVAARQTLLALFLDDPSVEKWLRRHPQQAAERYAVSLTFAQWLAALPATRVRLFRRSRIHKQRLRDGAAPTLLDE